MTQIAYSGHGPSMAACAEDVICRLTPFLAEVTAR